MKLAVCVATYRRPVMLAALLDSIAALPARREGEALTVVIVDNDDAGTAAEAIARRAAGFPFRIVQGLEPRRNIALARNRCIELAAAAGADWMVFVDDDEYVTPGWLDSLVQVQRDTDADIVSGPVLNDYPDGTPRWVVAAALPRRRRLPTGTRLDVADSANVMVARHVFDVVPGFDERFGNTGGSDTHFFTRAASAGCTMVWADEAVVYETVPRSRASAGWLLRRAFRTGNAGVHVARALQPARQWLPRRVAAAVYRIARGSLGVVPALFRGRGAVVEALQDVCVGAGTISALAGHRYLEYRRQHGT